MIFCCRTGNATGVEAEVGRTFKAGGLEAAYAWIEHHLKPRMEERWHTLRRKPSGKRRRHARHRNTPPWDRGTALRDGPAPFEGLGGRGRRLSFPPGHGRNHSLRHLRLFRFSAQSHFVYPPRPGHMRAWGIGTFTCGKRGLVLPLPVWHVGGAMIYLRAALAGTAVHTLRGKWCPQAYADLMKSSGARWSSLVPTQVVDLVSLGLRAPSTAGCIIVGGGALDTETGRKARTLGWPVVQSYGMTEAGSQLATALPGDSFHTDRLSLLPHWEAQTDKGGLLRFQGKGKLFGRLLTQAHGGFLLERVAPQEWWSTRDLVRLEGRLLTFLRRADRLVKVLGELVDPGCRSGRFAPQRPGGCRGGSSTSARRNGTGRLRPFRRPPEAGLPRVECVGPRPPAHPRRHGNAHPPHGHGKAGQKPAALPVERSSGKVEGNLLKGNLPGIFIKRIRT